MVQMEEKAFVSSLHSFMKEKGTPIERIPHLGFKQSEFTLLLLLYKHISKMELEKEVDYSCLCVSPPPHSQLISGRSTKLLINLEAMIQ